MITIPWATDRKGKKNRGIFMVQIERRDFHKRNTEGIDVEEHLVCER